MGNLSPRRDSPRDETSLRERLMRRGSPRTPPASPPRVPDATFRERFAKSVAPTPPALSVPVPLDSDSATSTPPFNDLTDSGLVRVHSGIRRHLTPEDAASPFWRASLVPSRA